MKLNHLYTEQNFWRSWLEPRTGGAKLLGDVVVDLQSGSVYCKIVHPNHVSGIQKEPGLVSRVDVDRAKRPEKEIMAEIEQVIKEKKDL